MPNDIYRQRILDRFHQPRFKGYLPEADRVVEQSNPLCGDTVQFQLKFDNELISEAVWQGQGCAISLAAADFLAEKVIGFNTAKASSLSMEDMLELLAIDLPLARHSCVFLSLACLKAGLTTGKV